MIIDKIKEANIVALKNKDKTARGIYSIIMNKYLLAEVEARTSGNKISDADMVKIISKTIKELTEEAENYKKAGNEIQAKEIEKQKEIISIYLPQMLTEAEIKQIINGLTDKSVAYVMRYFKTNFNGQCDMKVVSDVLKTIQ